MSLTDPTGLTCYYPNGGSNGVSAGSYLSTEIWRRRPRWMPPIPVGLGSPISSRSITVSFPMTIARPARRDATAVVSTARGSQSSGASWLQRTFGWLWATPQSLVIANDVPLNAKAQAIVQDLRKRIDNYPTICGAGAYFYAGKEFPFGTRRARFRWDLLRKPIPGRV